MTQDKVRICLCALVISFVLGLASVALRAQDEEEAPQRGRGRAPGVLTNDVTSSRSFDRKAVSRGEKYFGESCASCHGADARGGLKGHTNVDLIRSPLVIDDLQGREIGEYLKYGRPEKGMPEFDLPLEQVSDIATWLHYNIAVVVERGSYTHLNVDVADWGDAKAGEGYFNGQGKCNGCHSPTGDLKGIGAKYDLPTLQQRLLEGGSAAAFSGGRGRGGPAAPSATSRSVTITLPSGETVQGQLGDIDDFEVSIRLSDGSVRTFDRKGAIPKVVVKNPLQAHLELLPKYTDADMHNLTAYLATLK